MTRSSRLVLFSLSAVFTAAVAAGHELIYTRSFATPFELHARVAGLGDVNGDSAPDYALSMGGDGNGTVLVISGGTGSTIRAFAGDAQGRLGPIMAAIGDVDLDGVGDLAVTYGNAVRVFSLASGQILHTLASPGPTQDYFGTAICGVGDVDADGRADFAVGATQYFARGYIQSIGGPGYVQIFSGSSGNLIRTITGPAAGVAFGGSITNGGNLDGDGIDDLIVSETYKLSFSPARVHAFSGVNGAPIFSMLHQEAGGAVVAGLGDVDADGVGDFALGHYNSVSVISGGTLGVLHSRAGSALGDRFGACLARLGDLDGDGASELLVGAPQKYVCTGFCAPIGTQIGPGYATVLSGRTGVVVGTVVGEGWQQHLGSACAPLGDLDGDGKPEFIVTTEGGYSWSGLSPSVRIYRGSGSFSAPQRYCLASQSIDFSGSTSVSSNQLTLSLSGAAPGMSAQLFCGTSAAAFQFDFPSGPAPGFLCVGASLRRVGLSQPISPQGSAFVNVDLGPASPFTIGSTWYFQFVSVGSPWIRSTSGAIGMTFTP